MYEIKALGAHLKGGKLLPAVDQSSQAAENDLKGGKAPAKGGKPAATQELTEEEKAALAKKKQEQLDQAARL